MIYDRIDKTLAVFVHDAMTGEELLLPVSEDEATEVYRHPYAYAARAQSSRVDVVKAKRAVSAQIAG